MSQLYPLTSGGSIRSFNLLTESAKYNEITLINLTRPGNNKEQFNALSKYCKKIIEIPFIPKRHKIVRLLDKLIWNRSSEIALLDSKEMHRAIRSAIANDNFDIVLGSSMYAMLFANEFKNIPIIMLEQNAEYLIIERRAKTALGIHRYLQLKEAHNFKLFEAAALRKAVCTIAVSDIDAVLLKDLAPEANIRVVPNGVDTKYFEHVNELKQEQEIVFVGTMGYYPNIDAITWFYNSIWPLILQEEPKTRLSIIGNAPASVAALFKDKPNVDFHGMVPDIRPFLTKAAVSIVPIRIGSGTRVKILDAMSMKKAIVTTTIGCEGIKVTDKYDIIIADKEDDFAKAVLNLLKHENLRIQLGNNARATVEKLYSWESISKIQQSVFNEVKSMLGKTNL
jgi:glycosyltransferase involved in cell wall biosynthesis